MVPHLCLFAQVFAYAAQRIMGMQPTQMGSHTVL